MLMVKKSLATKHLLQFCWWPLCSLLYIFFATQTDTQYIAGWISFVGEAGLDLTLCLLFGVLARRSPDHNLKIFALLQCFGFFCALFSDGIYNFFINILSLKVLTNFQDSLFDIPFLVFLLFQLLAWAHLAFSYIQYSKKQIKIFYVLLPIFLISLIVFLPVWHYKNISHLIEIYQKIDTLFEILGIACCCFCLVCFRTKHMDYIAMGFGLIVLSDLFIRSEFLQQVSIKESFFEMVWILGLFCMTYGLVHYIKKPFSNLGECFLRPNSMRIKTSSWILVMTTWMLLLSMFLLKIALYHKADNFLQDIEIEPLLVIFAALLFSSVFFSRMLSKRISDPLEKLRNNIFLLREDKPTSVKMELPAQTTEEILVLQNFIVEAFKHKEEKDRAKKQLGEITAQVAHDIRSPTAAILMLAKNSSELPEDRRIILREAANRIQDIANNLLVQYRTQDDSAHSLSNKASEVLVSSAIASIISEKRIQLDHQHIQFITKIRPAGYFAFIKVDLSRFTRTISNLINNASEAMNQRGTITLILEVEDSQVKIIIRDEGKGMPAALIAKIKNAEHITSDKKEGHGLGLCYALETVHQSQGSLDIQSIAGKGTDVILQFPRLANPAWMAEAIKLKTHDIIVILDDDISIHGAWDQRFQNTLVQNKTLTIKHFQQGLEAIQFINQCDKKDHIFLLTDYELLQQTVNGLDVIEQTGVNRSIMVSSHYTNQKLIDRALSLKATVLPKLLASEIEIKLQEDTHSAVEPLKLDAILIDDEDFNHTFWQFSAKKNQKLLKCFHSSEEFDAVKASVPFDTPDLV